MSYIIMGHRKKYQNIVIIVNILLTDTFVYIDPQLMDSKWTEFGIE